MPGFMLRSMMSRENNTSTNVGAPDATPLFSGVFRPANIHIPYNYLAIAQYLIWITPLNDPSGRKMIVADRKIRVRTTSFREWSKLQRFQ